MSAALPQPEFIAGPVVAKVLGLSRDTFRRWELSGLVGPIPIRCNNQRLYVASEIQKWIAQAKKQKRFMTRNEWA